MKKNLSVIDYYVPENFSFSKKYQGYHFQPQYPFNFIIIYSAFKSIFFDIFQIVYYFLLILILNIQFNYFILKFFELNFYFLFNIKLPNFKLLI